MRKNATGQRKAIAGILALVDEMREGGETQLPGMRELSERLGVAYVTVGKALKELCRQGVLQTVRGKGTFIAEAGSQQTTSRVVPEVPVGGTTWERVAAMVKQDVLRHVHAPGRQLPSTGELAHSYGVSYRTIQKALTSLAADGLVVPHGNGFRASDLTAVGGRGSVVLLARGAEALNRLSVRGQEFFRTMQSECARLNIQLKIVFCEYGLSGGVEVPRQWVHLVDDPSGHAVLGYLMFGRGLNEQFILSTLRTLDRSNLPVAMLDESGDVGWPPGLSRHTRTRLFSISSSDLSGLMVGRFLLGHGHRRVAYICPAHGATWSHNRLAGLHRVFAEAGYPDAVRECTTDRVQPQEGVGGFTASVEEAVNRMRVPKELGLGEHGPLLSRVLSRLSMRIGEEVGREALNAHVVPMLQELLREKDITAWVASNDNVGIQCLQFLHRHDIPVPGRISVIGFDDTLEAFLGKLTSYNHNTSAVMHAMLAHILNPRQAPKPSRRGAAVEIEGFVTQRETVGEMGGRE